MWLWGCASGPVLSHPIRLFPSRCFLSEQNVPQAEWDSLEGLRGPGV